MKKIVVVYDETQASEALISTLNELFPECEIIGVPKDKASPEMDETLCPPKRANTRQGGYNGNV